MLCNLVVENYALIGKLEIEFRKGLTIITGETGAGKSILLGALSLILGRRADTSVLYDKGKKCIVEGTFDISNYGLNNFFLENSIDYDNETIIRREISATGKSRAFINDIPVNLELLNELCLKLIDIHSQHQNLNLSDSIFQMKVLDGFSKNGDILSIYKDKFQKYRNVKLQYDHLVDEASKSKTDLDFFQFQYNQLHEAQLKEGEQDELEQELEKLTHSEDIKTALSDSLLLLSGDGNTALQQIKDSINAIKKIDKFLHGHEDLSARIDSSFIEIKDIVNEIELLNSQIYYDPERLNEVNDRLSLIYNLEKKHKVSTISELIGIRDQLKIKISEISSYDENLEALEKELSVLQSDLTKISSELSEKRIAAIPDFEQKIVKMLHELGISNADFNIMLSRNTEFNFNGIDNIQFFFSANKNAKPQDIARVASGGEISRLMLCIKSLISDSTGLPTIVFDEIDTGVSGEIAERVGNIINRMSEKIQIINITHLPQVASKGKYHYLVYKINDSQKTATKIKLLSPEERLLEIAKMLSGEEVTKAALENAKALLGK